MVLDRIPLIDTISACIPTVEDVDLNPTYVVVRIDPGGQGYMAQSVDAFVSKTKCCWFESSYTYRSLV